MEHLYIDESGSMTNVYTKNNKYFVVSIIRVLDEKKLNRSLKFFIRKHLKELELNDRSNRMFSNGKFKELKGSGMSPNLKKEFIKFVAQDKSFEIFYIVLDNSKINSNLYENTARAFNFTLKCAIEYLLNHKYLNKNEEIFIKVDERNERPDAKAFLEQYLNTSFQLENHLTKEIIVRYFDSKDNLLIQLADVFANIKFSELMTGTYKNEFKLLENSKILKFTYKFPLW